MVVTDFIPLARRAVKHSYHLNVTVRVPADYVVYCGGEACDQIASARRDAQTWGSTTIVRDFGTIERLTSFMANELGVTQERLHRAAAACTTVADVYDGQWGGNCPSADILLIWASKVLLVLDAMRRFPERQVFAYVDAGFNRYQGAHHVPMAPWLRVQPLAAIAVRFYESHGTCHNQVRATQFSHCIYAAYLFGPRTAWLPFGHAVRDRLRTIVETQDVWIRQGLKLLCSDQDILTEVAVQHPWLVQELLPRNDWTWDVSELTLPAAWLADVETGFRGEIPIGW